MHLECSVFITIALRDVLCHNSSDSFCVLICGLGSTLLVQVCVYAGVGKNKPVQIHQLLADHGK